jgi:hypothetical protein
MGDLPNCIFKRWIHSFEEDSGSTKVFRSSDFDLPLTRAPRHGYEFRKDGEVFRLGSGASDENIAIKGRFRKEGENKLVLYFNDDDDDESAKQQLRIEILSCDENVLKIKEANF